MCRMAVTAVLVLPAVKFMSSGSRICLQCHVLENGLAFPWSGVKKGIIIQ